MLMMYRRLVVLSIFFILSVHTINASEPSLSVRGQATIAKPADQLQISIGVTTTGVDAKSALKDNNKKMNQLIKAFSDMGLSQNEYQTGQFSIHPIYTNRPNSAPSDWTAKIVGFEIVNTLDIQTDKIDQAGDLIDAATSAGANSINSINFNISNMQKFRDELIYAATSNAIEDAKSLSQAAGVKLKKITSITIDDAASPPRQPYMMKSMAAEGTPIAAGDVEMRASVSVIFEID